MRHRHHLPFVLLALLVGGLTLSACGDDSTGSGTAGGTDRGTPATAEQLEANGWTLRSFAFGDAGDLEAASSTSPGTAAFDGKTVSGTTGCNSYSGSYTLGADGAIKIGPIASTQKFCEEVADQEQGMTIGLDQARTVTEADGALDFLDGDGEVLLIFDAS